MAKLVALVFVDDAGTEFPMALNVDDALDMEGVKETIGMGLTSGGYRRFEERVTGVPSAGPALAGEASAYGPGDGLLITFLDAGGKYVTFLILAPKDDIFESDDETLDVEASGVQDQIDMMIESWKTPGGVDLASYVSGKRIGGIYYGPPRTSEEQVRMLIGPIGQPGEQGEQGVAGEQGEQGEQGEAGSDAEVVLVQEIWVPYNAAAGTFTTLIPFDDSKPQSSEGTEVLTGSITLTDATSKIRIEASINVGTNSGQHIAGAAFLDSAADAFAANQVAVASNFAQNLLIWGEVTPGATGTYTIKIRCGEQTNGGGAAWWTNGYNGARRFGDIPKGGMWIREYKPI